MDLLIVIPCRDGAETLPIALDSLLAQTEPARRIVVVDDGSTDRTAEIALSYARRSPTVGYLRRPRPNEARESGRGIAEVVMYGMRELDWRSYAYVAKFDDDDQYPPDYLARCLAAFEANPRAGLVGGLCNVRDAAGEWVPEQIAKDDHVRGGLKVYRREAFAEMGGIAPCTGWDTIDEHRLRYLGWDVVVLVDGARVNHHRATHAATPPHRMARKLGRSLYNMGASADVVFVSLLKQSIVGHSRLPFWSAVAGYLEAWRAGPPPELTSEEAAFANAYRRRGYREQLARYAPQLGGQ